MTPPLWLRGGDGHHHPDRRAIGEVSRYPASTLAKLADPDPIDGLACRAPAKARADQACTSVVVLSTLPSSVRAGNLGTSK
jgi:hypothetical protein